MAEMKAVRLHEYGGAEALVYEAAPRPEPGEGEVLIRVRATSVNPFDCAVRAGYLASYLQYTFPLILGVDASGVIEEVGPGVDTFKPGDEVYARGGVSRDGTYAEYAVVPATDVAAKPSSLNFLQAAALPHVTVTAWEALIHHGQLSSGQTILIHGAAGGVGHIATQLAKWRGANVIGTTSRNFDFLEALGADRVIDYSKTPFEDVVADVDVVLDLVGGDTQQRSYQVLKPGGMLVSTVQAPSAEEAANYGVRQAMCYMAVPIGQVLTEVAGLVDDGQVGPHVSTVLPLEEVGRAQKMVEGQHTQGKVVVQVAP